MSRADAFRRLLAMPLDHVDQQRIGSRILYATPDGRERLTYAYRVLTTVAPKLILRRVA